MSENYEIDSVMIKLFADLREFGPDKVEENLTKRSNINNIFEKYEIPKEKNTIILVNRKPCYDRNSVLKDGDAVAIFPPLAGG
jgi:molybdopterin converting factor small subunit